MDCQCIGTLDVMSKDETYARLEVLFVLHPDIGWEELTPESRIELFPPQGTVYRFIGESVTPETPTIATTLNSNRLIYFCATPTKNPNSRDGHDEYIADLSRECIPLVQAIDRRDTDIEAIFEEFFYKGIDEPVNAQRVFIRLKEEQGVLVTLEDAVRNSIVKEKKVYKTSAIDESRFICFKNGNYVFPRDVFSPKDSEDIHWEEEQDFLRGLLKELEGHSTASEHTRKTAKDLKDYLEEKLKIPDVNSSLKIFERERVKKLLYTLEMGERHHDALEEIVLSSEYAKQRIEEGKLEFYKASEDGHRQEIAFKYKQQKMELEEIDAGLQRKEFMKRELTAENQSIKDSIDTQLGNLKKAFKGMSPQELVYAQEFASRVEQEIGLSSEAPPFSFFPSATPPWASGGFAHQSSEYKPIKLQNLNRRLYGERTKSVDLTTLSLIDSFSRAGEFIVLLGASANHYIKSYSSCLGSDKLYFMQPDLSTLSLDDLWKKPGTGEWTAFALAWHSAVQEPERFHILWLNCFNHSPWHLWIEALFIVLQSAVRPKNFLILGTLSLDGQFLQESSHYIARLKDSAVFLAPQVGPPSEEPPSHLETRLFLDVTKDSYDIQLAEISDIGLELSEIPDVRKRQCKIHRINPNALSRILPWPLESSRIAEDAPSLTTERELLLLGTEELEKYIF